MIKPALEDLRHELSVLAELLPEQSPLPYAKARLLVLSWSRLGQDVLEWSGVNLVIRIDPVPYESGDPRYEVYPMQVKEGADIWKPFAAPWIEVANKIPLFDLAVYLKLVLGTWGTAPVARRRHVKKDRLDGLGLGIRIYPQDSTASIYVRSKRSILDIVEKDLADQIR